jgi:transcriptional regulator with XRE-family HTH domain
VIQLGSPTPIGIGTAECEALSSYVQRLAASNGTYPGQLVHRLLGWLQSGEPSGVGLWMSRPQSFYLGRNINAFGLAETWLHALDHVLPGNGLKKLTANYWAPAFPSRGVLKASLAWCPDCLAGDLIPYHRLLWQLQPGARCRRHRILLSTQCSRCGRAPPVIHDRSHVEICAWCSGDLREAGRLKISQMGAEEEEIGEVIAHFGQSGKDTRWVSRDTVRALAGFCDLRTPNELARAVSVSKVTVWGWWRGENRISLPLAMHTFSRLQVSFSTALTDHGFRRLQPRPENHQMAFHFSARKAPRKIDWPLVGRQLMGICRRPLEEAPTLLAAAQELGINRRTLRNHFPTLCRRISRRHRKSEQRSRLRRDRELTTRLRFAVRIARSTHQTPHQRLVEQILRRPGLFHSHYARALLQDLLSDFERAAPSA